MPRQLTHARRLGELYMNEAFKPYEGLLGK
jgi:hypothetical protein